MYRNTTIRFAFVSLCWLFPGAPALAQGSPDQAVMDVVNGLGQNRPQVIWQALPASYQRDVSGLVQEFAGQMEGSLWDQTFATLSKLTRVLDEKRQFLLGHPMVAQQLSASPNAEASYDAVVALLEVLMTSELASLESLQGFDGERFLTTTGSQLMQRMDDLAALSPESKETLDGLSSLHVRPGRQEGDRTWIVVERAGEEPQEVEMVVVEGKWVPAEMAQSWDSTMQGAREQLGQLAFDPAQSAQAGMVLAMVDGALEGLLAAQTEEEFQTALGGILGLAMMGGAMGSSGSPDSGQ